MVLGLILYEGVDILVNLGKITYNAGRGTYYWLYGIEYPEIQKNNEQIKDMKLLMDKIDELQKKIEDTQKNIEVDDKKYK